MEIRSSAFPLYFRVYKFRRKSYLLWFRRGCFPVGASLCRLCESSILGLRTTVGMDASLILPQGVLATVPWIRGVCGVQSLRWDIVQGLLFTLWSSQPCLSHLLEFTEPNSYENV